MKLFLVLVFPKVLQFVANRRSGLLREIRKKGPKPLS